MTIPGATCTTLGLYTAWMLWQLKAPPGLALGVFLFQLCSPIFFFVQSSLIVVATFKLACSGGKEIDWVPTKRSAPA